MSRKLRISFGERHHADVTKVRELSWEELSAWLVKDPPVADNKEARGWFCGAVFGPATERDVAANPNYALKGVAYRHGDNFLERNILTLDFDHVDELAFDVITTMISSYAFAAYTTWSHLAPGKGHRFRIVMPLSRPAGSDEFQAVTRKVAQKMGIELVAAESFVPAQFMFSPLKREGGEHRALSNISGKWIDVDQVLGQYRDWTDRDEWPRRKQGDNPYDKDTIISPLDKPGIVGDFCRAFSISKAIDRFELPYAPTATEGRWTYTAGSRPEGAIVYDDDTKLHSHHDTDPARGQCNAFDLVRLHRFSELDRESIAAGESSVTELPSYKAMCKLAHEQPEIQALSIADFEDLGPEPPPKPEFEAIPDVAQSVPCDNVHADSSVLARRISDVLRNPTSPRWLIRDELERAVIAIMAGPRGSYKSFIALDWAMRCATNTQLGYPVDNAHPVYVVSAEGGDFDRRARAWLLHHCPDKNMEDIPLYVVERRLDLNSVDGIAAIRDDCKRLGIRPVLFVLDTFSKLSGGLDENDNSTVKQFIGRLDLGLKRRETAFDATVLLVCHTGHSDSGRPRGASAIAADTDAEYIVARQESAASVTVSRERFKASPELPPLCYKPHVVELGYTDDQGQAVTSLVMLGAEPPRARTKTAPQGRNQQIIFQVISDLTKDGTAADTVCVLNEFCNRLPIDEESGGRDNRRNNARTAIESLIAKRLVFLHPENRISLTELKTVDEDSWLG